MIELTVVGSNAPALVDDDFADLARYRWRLGQGYAFRYGDKRIMLHHVVLPEAPAPGLVRDHINRNRLDSRRCNLRWVTKTENAQNCSPSISKGLGIRGVRFDTVAGRYLARVQSHGKALVRAWFDDPIEAGEFLRQGRMRLMPVSHEAI
jgi:hypothetical protein